MSIKDLVHRLAVQSSGGITALAARMGVPYSTLKSKLNPSCSTHHFYINELEQIVDLLDTDAVAQYFCAQRDGVFVKATPIDGVSDIELLDLFLERESRYGNFAKRVREVLATGGIGQAEYDDLMRLYDDVSESREQIKRRLKSLHDQTMERALRLKIQSVK